MGSGGHSWQGRPILDPAHAADLDQRAAVREFGQRQPRAQAEEAAHAEYRREHHVAGAAHHLRGILAAHASGDRETARTHALHYGLHLRALGHETFGEVPPEIRRRAQAENPDKFHSFKGHAADRFISEHLGKAEAPRGWMPAFVNPFTASTPKPPPFRPPGSPHYEIGHEVVMRGDKGDQFGRLDVGRVVGREHRGSQGHHYRVEWTKPYEDLKYSGTHPEHALSPAPLAAKKSENAMDQTPGQKLQKFWDEKHEREQKGNLLKRAQAGLLELMARRLEKGGATGGVAENTVKAELCKQCGEPHAPDQHMKKGEEKEKANSKGKRALWDQDKPHFGGQGSHRYDGGECVYCGRPRDYQPKKVQKSEKEAARDAARAFWDNKPFRPYFKYVS